MKVRSIWNLSSKLTNLLLDHSRDSQTQALDLSIGMFQFERSCIHTLNQHILAPSTFSSTQPTPSQSVDSDAGGAHGVENGPSNSEADINTNTTTTLLDPAGLGQVRPNESTPWWNYVGWTSASNSTGTTASTLTRPMNDVAIVPIQASVANASQELKLTTPSAAIENANAESATMGSAESGLVNEAEEGKAAEPAEKAKEEVQDGDQPVPISSWYSAWGWYSSTNASGPVQRESESLEVKTTSEDPQVDVPLPVSRSEPTSAASSETREGGDMPFASAHLPSPINPITTSMEANWSGWASFFGSRTLMVKTLGYGGGRIQDVKRDEDGMEVMDLNDDEDEQRNVGEGALSKDSEREDGVRDKAMSSPPILIAKTRPIIQKPSDSQDSQTSRFELQISDSTGNKGELSVSKSPAKSSISSTPEKGNSRSNTPIPVPIPPSSSPSSRDGNFNQSLPKTPNISKKVNNSRTASPAPSKKSVSSPPPLPNLVLPTWEQTFNTAPRNMLPVTNKPERYLEGQTAGGKLLGKTMRFVSGMLFTRDTSDGSPESGQIKGKEREMDRNRDIDFKKWEEERFREFGKELPKSWQIEEPGLGADTTPTTPTSHIPIFGFGSPKFTKKGDLRSTNKESQIGVSASGVDEYEGLSRSRGMKDVLRGCKRVVVIGIHGWFPGVFSIQISFE